MEIEILHIEDCPNWQEAVDRVREVLTDLGAEHSTVRVTLLSSPAEAAKVAFAGSPTILIDGVDGFPSSGRSSDLACRVYLADGRFAGVPSRSDLRAVVSAALSRRR